MNWVLVIGSFGPLALLLAVVRSSVARGWDPSYSLLARTFPACKTLVEVKDLISDRRTRVRISYENDAQMRALHQFMSDRYGVSDVEYPVAFNISHGKTALSGPRVERGPLPSRDKILEDLDAEIEERLIRRVEVLSILVVLVWIGALYVISRT